SSVATSRTFIIPAGEFNDASSGGNDDCRVGVELTDATTVSGYRAADGGNMTVSLFVVEGTANLVTSVQYGKVTISTSIYSETASISAVNTANSIILSLGGTIPYTSTGHRWNYAKGCWGFNSSTEIELNRWSNYAGYSVEFYYCVVEFNPSAIESIQKVDFDSSITTYEDVTISAVSTADTALLSGGMTSGHSNGNASARFTLYDSDTVRMQTNGVTAVPRVGVIWAVEFADGVLEHSQYVEKDLGASLTGTSAITAVTQANATLTHLGLESDDVDAKIIDQLAAVSFNSGTQIAFERGGSTDESHKINVNVLEWSMES
ncbi:MAG: hypothetical protein ACPG80_00135, partial [Rickettsiales bacterium]